MVLTSPPPRPRVLVVDDEATTRAFLRATLEQAGFHVEEVCDGWSALERFAQGKHDIVLLDIVMPGPDGYSTCEALRRAPGGEAVPIVIMTSRNDEHAVERALSAGATDFATKPLDFVLLAQRMRGMLQARHAIAEVRRGRRRLLAAQRLGKLGAWEWNLTSRRFRLSAGVRRMLGVESGNGDMSFGDFARLVHPSDRAAVTTALLSTAEIGKPISIEHRVAAPDGADRHVRHEAEIVRDEVTGDPVVLGTVQEITERRRAENLVARLAFYDDLTGLPNRALLRLEHGMFRPDAPPRGGPVGLMLLDIDRFKRINDTLGHTAGDKLLRAIATRLTGLLRSDDLLIGLGAHPCGGAAPGPTLGRMGGDELLLVLPRVCSAETAATVARRILSSLAEPFRLDGREVVVSASIGIALPGSGDEPADALVRNADAAMYAAKAAGGNTYRFYCDNLRVTAAARLDLELHLRSALPLRQLELHYQPKIHVESGRVVGAEALLRWRHPTRGYVSPAELVPVAEETGLIGSIGDWCLREAAEQLREWQERGEQPLRIAVNVSARQMADGSIVRGVRRAITEAGIAPSDLELEITEGVLVHDTRIAGAVLAELKSLGLRIALDDFGTGYSSLAYLARFPVDTLKIDRSFVRDALTSTQSAGITRAILAMARTLDLNVVAEGVETVDQLEFLAAHGCPEVQGYLFSRPLPPEAFVEWLRRSGKPCLGFPRARASAEAPPSAAPGESRPNGKDLGGSSVTSPGAPARRDPSTTEPMACPRRTTTVRSPGTPTRDAPAETVSTAASGRRARTRDATDRIARG